MSMCLWVRAVAAYARVAEAAAPLHAQLHAAQERLDSANAHLQGKQAELQARFSCSIAGSAWQ
jgi:hypothetical protein